MKAIHGTAICTGDGYSVIGNTDAGWFFHGTSDGWLEILADDPRSLDENGDMLCFDAEWTEKHRIANMNTPAACNMIVDFCKRLDAEEAGITDGYEDFSNYIPGEVTRYITKSLQVC